MLCAWVGRKKKQVSLKGKEVGVFSSFFLGELLGCEDGEDI